MIVLMDMEWAENIRGEKSAAQIACLRVDENWQRTDRFFTRIRTMDCETCTGISNAMMTN